MLDADVMGDAKKMAEEWNHDKYQEFRRLHLEGKIPKMCRNCYMELI